MATIRGGLSATLVTVAIGFFGQARDPPKYECCSDVLHPDGE